MKTIGAAKFKEKCLALLDELEPDGLIITKHGRPVARVTPYPISTRDLIGRLRGKLTINGDILSTGVSWDVNGQS